MHLLLSIRAPTRQRRWLAVFNHPSVCWRSLVWKLSRIRRMRRVLLGLLVLVLAYFAVTTTLVARWMGKDERPRVDAIVVLGAAQYDGRPSAIYEARLEHAVELWRQDVAPLLVFTGGKEPGDRFTEGGSGARWAVARGVPETAVLTEERSRTTYQNLAGAMRALERRNDGGRHRIVVVSDPFHMFRAVRQAADLGMDAYPSPTRTSPLSASRLKLTELVLREDLAIAGYLLSGAGK
jgi:uncharacterized SAM-binding protein YcdF (DUF218 family)